jgi:hypothetical protein
MVELYLLPAIVMGSLIGLIELFFVHMDERGLGWLSHGLHALPIAFAFTFVAMNLSYAANLVGFALHETFWVDLGLRAGLGVVAAIKVKSAAAIVKGHNSVGEKMSHALIVGALIAASPYLWELVAPLMPGWLS